MRRNHPSGPHRAARVAILLLAGLPSIAAASDLYPQGALAFFDIQACPEGWSPALSAANQPLNGYFVIPFAQPLPPGTLGITVNQPLWPGEDRTHSHSFSSQITLTDFSLAGAGGCSRLFCSTMTNAGAQGFSGTTGAASSGLPYVTYLFCEKTAFHHNQNPPAGIPQYLAAFFRDATCPVGWKPVLATDGQLIVGLPAAGTQGMTTGGQSLKPGEDRTHTHVFSGQIPLGSADVAGATSCCNDGFGRAGTYPYSGTTDAASTGLPYVMVSQCQTCLPGDADPACLGKRD